MKILIVDDDQGKAETVSAALQAELPTYDLHIEIAQDQISAKAALRREYFDLVIVDLALPLRKGEAPERLGGIQLVKEALARDVYVRPGHFVGLTAYADIYETAGADFDSELWSLLYFDTNSVSWLDPIVDRIRHLSGVRTEISASQEESRYDVCIVLALKVEVEAIKRNGWDWTLNDVPGDSTLYFSSTYRRSNGQTGRALVARTPIMGMSAASILATKMGFHFRPRCLVMSGVCAGDSEQVQLGDLIAGNPVWDYGSGKHIGTDIDNETFEPAPFQIAISTRLRGLAERLAEDAQFFETIHREFEGPKPPSRGVLHIGPFASGAAVVANKALFREIQSKQHRKLIGIDMEAFGVMSAANELVLPQPECLVMKAVSDFADIDKGDKFRHYAAYASARAVTALCERYDL